MLTKNPSVENWIREAIKKGYHEREIRGVLLKSGYSHDQVLRVLSMYNKLKEKKKKNYSFSPRPSDIFSQSTLKKMQNPQLTSQTSQKSPQVSPQQDTNSKIQEKNSPTSNQPKKEGPVEIHQPIVRTKPKKLTGKEIEAYDLEIDRAKISVKIEKIDRGLLYSLEYPEINTATKALLEEIRKELISVSAIAVGEIVDQKSVKKIKAHFMEVAGKILKEKVPHVSNESEKFLVGTLMQEMLGLGKIEFLINDPNLEEIVIVSSKEVRIYHKKHGWILTNVTLPSEDDVINYANIIARRVGRQISILNPLLDAHVVTGDRANAVLYPIATKGNTITIRKFSRDPWTIVDLIMNNTLSKEVAALLWLAIEYEMNVIFSGGTASGKTVCLNACMPFIPPNHRVISMEDTRELMLPKFLYWCPLVTRTSNAERKGEVSMLDLLVNSLRMRPDRIILGEMRRQKEAEVLFEAMHTGHSVYATVHADTANETIRRLTNPPISVPPSMLSSVNLNAVMFRDRRRGLRRVFQLAEFIQGKETVTANLLYRWIPERDNFVMHNKSLSFYDELSRNTGMDEVEIERNLAYKRAIFDWLIKNKIRNLESFGKLMNYYYTDRARLDRIIRENRVNDIIEKNIEE